jgi:hypothetical protein
MIIYLSSNKIQGRFNNIILPIIDNGIISAIKETQYGAHFNTAIEIFKNYPVFGVGNKNFREECLKEKYKENSKQWLYFMAGNESIKRFSSCPKSIVKDLQAFI